MYPLKILSWTAMTCLFIKNQLDGKDKVINTLLEKLVKKTSWRNSTSQATINGSSVIQTSYVIQATSVKTQHDNINMNQNSTINNITTTQNITQVITKTDVSLTFTENTKNKSDIENKCITICRESIVQDQPIENPKCIKKLVIILGDSMIKHTNGWKIAKKLKPKCKIFVITFPGATTQCMADYMKPSI